MESAANIAEAIPLDGVTVQVIAEKIEGRISGDENLKLTGIQPLEFAGPRDLSFLAASGKSQQARLFELAKKTKAGAILIAQHEPALNVTQIVTPHPLKAVIGLSSFFYQPPQLEPGIHPQAVVAKSAELGANVRVGALAVIGENVQIGDNTVIHPHVVIYPSAIIGKDCVIHAGAVVREHVEVGSDCIVQNGVVLGSDGFGYVADEEKGHCRIPHIGKVVLEDGVDVGSNSTIDRATLGESRIGGGTKIDNLVMIGHNVTIGKRSLLCGQAGVAGSCKIGSDVTLGGQVGVSDHVEIGDKVRAVGQTGVSSSVKSNTDVAGMPCQEVHAWRRSMAYLAKISDLVTRIRRIEKKLGLNSTTGKNK